MKKEEAIFAGGCFWCIEAVFNQIQGVESAISGYIGGMRPNPSYEQVCTGATGHAEAVKVRFDSEKISYEQLLNIFFAIHDPTQLNRQGNDIGTQYRSAIFYLNAQQKQQATQKLIEIQPHFIEKVVTELTEATTFYPAENYHQGYFLQNPNKGYCQLVVAPKFLKAKLQFETLWKS
ncbi:peptide-methionine (S)-S-oxide reductase MsrA [Conservatibacter flavescens]|uniref:Peptide methionine sulfoxide reductase MsrA n=1 Tax=Conservatibacter flavescens TaxID=28161 RepID=A0A2M8S5G2_9PAST|nr:peptide-methionine (S)-S-oxide reductase MsrA [Conservatibacter flavescens]PJG86361.1 peptide-methionine (S)-S-oxide reductase [Conservatibacter flavescens]